MKKIVCLLLCLALGLFFVGCGTAESGKMKIVTTVLPQYDWVKNLTAGAKNLEITLISDNGVDMHSFQPSAEDVLKISSADLFVYIGGPSEKWVEDALKNAQNENMSRVNLSEILEKSGRGSHANHSHNGEECREAIDEHIWLSLKNARLFCGEIANRLITLDPQNKELYSKNLGDYLKDLDRLDGRYADTVAAAQKDTLVFADRFPFVYLLEDYKIEHLAAFEGCSADAKADFDTVFGLAQGVDRLGLDAVLVTDNGNVKLAESVIANTKTKSAKILSLNSMQATTLKELQKGETYLLVMESNLSIIKTALGG